MKKHLLGLLSLILSFSLLMIPMSSMAETISGGSTLITVSGTVCLPDGALAPVGGEAFTIRLWEDQGDYSWSLISTVSVVVPEGQSLADYEITLTSGDYTFEVWPSNPLYCMGFYENTGYPPFLQPAAAFPVSIDTMTIPSIMIVRLFDVFTDAQGATWNYRVLGADSVEIQGCDASGIIDIPAMIGGRQVTSIGSGMFWNRLDITDVHIPDSVTRIGDYAFLYCKSLTSITIPDSVTYVGNEAFSDCSGLLSVTMGSGVSFLGEWPFYGCTSLGRFDVSPYNMYFSNDADGVLFNKSKSVLLQYPATIEGSYTVPEGVETIGDQAFAKASGLTDLIIPEGVVNLGSSALWECSGLVRLSIPASLVNIGDIMYCRNLETIEVHPDNPVYSSLDNVLYDKAQTLLILCPAEKSGEFIIPESVTTIRWGAFYVCSELTDVTIPPSVSMIEGNPFETGCTSLIHINVAPGNLSYKSIEGLLLDSSNTLLAFPGGISGDYTIPDGVTGIGYYAFSNSTSLVNLRIGSSVTSVGDWAFSNSANLESVTFGGSVTTIGNYLFSGSRNVRAAYFEGSRPDFFMPFDDTTPEFMAYYHVGQEASWAGYAASPYFNLTLDYGYDGLSRILPTPVAADRHIAVPSQPIRTGYSFEGWYKDAAFEQEWLFGEDMADSDLTLFAKWATSSQTVVIATPEGSDIPVNLENGIHLVFDTVVSAGDTSITALTDIPEGNYFYLDEPIAYYEINTQAEFVENVTVNIPYDETLITGSEAELRLYQFKDGVPVDITTSVDTSNNVITGVVQHFCVFAIGIPQRHEADISYTGQTLIPLTGDTTLSCSVRAANQDQFFDFSNIRVAFQVTASGIDGVPGETMLYETPCDAFGNATLFKQLDPGVYKIDVRIIDNGYASEAFDQALITVYDPAGLYAAGSGWFCNSNPKTGDVSETHFALFAKYKTPKTADNLMFQCQVGDWTFTSTQADLQAISSVSAQFSGIGTMDGMDGIYSFRMSITDNDKKGKRDKVSIMIWSGTDTDSDPIFKVLNQELEFGDVIIKTK